MANKTIKRLIVIAAAILPCLAITACDRFFGHDDQVQDPLVMKDQGMSCVRSAGPDLKAFFAGEDRDPVRVIDCISGALAKFASNTRGANSDGWTRGELSSFFETYFKVEAAGAKPDGVSGRNVPDDKSPIAPFDDNWVAQARRRAVVTELFRWKAALLGGGETTISRVEIQRVRTVLQKLRQPLSEWRGRGRILSFAADLTGRSVDVADLTRLTMAVREAAGILATELSFNAVDKDGRPTREPMKLKTLSSSLEQAGVQILQPEERQALMQTVKRFVLSGTDDQIGGDEWGNLVRQGSELWIGALRVQYGILQNTRAFNRDIDFVEMTAREILKSIGQMVDQHGGSIDNDMIRELVTGLENNKFTPKSVRAKSINASLEAIFGKLLGGNSLPNQDELSKGLKQAHLARLIDVVHDWSEGQRISMKVMGGAESATVDQARQSMSVIISADKDAVSAVARGQMSELILRGRPLVHDSLGRLAIAVRNQQQGRIEFSPNVYRSTDLETLNITRVLMNATMRGYSHDASRAAEMPEITENEMQEVFTDLKAIGRDLGIVDVRSLQSGVRTFMEANIFLSVSDGNDFVSLHEMVEWFEMVMGAGKIADQIHRDLVQDYKCGTSPLDVFGKQRLIAKCFRDHVATVFEKRLSHLPVFIDALAKAKKAGRQEAFIRSLEKSTRALADSDLPIESSDIRAMSPVIHYGEALFTRFDADDSSLLETSEVWDVFPLVNPFIRKMAIDSGAKASDLNVGMQRAIFSWLIMFGAPPAPGWWGTAQLLGHRWSPFPAHEKADFESIVNILASFQHVGRQKKNNEVLKYYALSPKAWETGIASADKAIMTKTRMLAQCSAEADADLMRLLQARRDDLFASDPKKKEDENAQDFLTRLKSMVQSDPQLQVLCMAF